MNSATTAMIAKLRLGADFTSLKKPSAFASLSRGGSNQPRVGSKTKVAIKGHGVNVAGDALESLNKVVYWYIEQAAQRAGANGRKTVRAHDFIG